MVYDICPNKGQNFQPAKRDVSSTPTNESLVVAYRLRENKAVRYVFEVRGVSGTRLICDLLAQD